jgi:lipopolysaccharide biosynthesis regulator YciM
MTEDEELPVSTDEYRELAAFLEQQIADSESKSAEEIDALRSRLGQLHEMLQEPGRDEAPEEAHVNGTEAAPPEAPQPPEPAPEPPPPPPPVEAEAPSDPLQSLEALVAEAPGDDDLRQRYIELAESLNAQLRAAETLKRALAEEADAIVRERVGFDVAMLYLGEGELPEARSAFLDVVRSGAEGAMSLSAARRLLNLQVESADPGLVAPALELVAKFDTDPSERRESGEKILALHASIPQSDARLLAAYRALIGSPRTDEALGWLRGFHAQRGEKRALSTWLEQAESWEPLARVLELDAELVPRGERAPLLARLGQIRLVRLGDVDGSLVAFGRCLILDATNETARDAVEGLLESPERRLAAARILEPIYRDAGFQEGYLRVLETRAAEAPSDVDALEALLETLLKLGHVDEALVALGRGEVSFLGHERQAMRVRAARALARHGHGEKAREQCRALIAESVLEPAVVEEIAQIANDEDDQELHRLALELLSTLGDDRAKKRALERLGDFQFDKLGDRRAAAESWRPAARIYESVPEEEAHAQLLYERVLEAVPDDPEAAQRLVEFYARAEDWRKLPDVLRVALRVGGDASHAAELLLRLEKSAIQASEVGEFASLVQDVIGRLGQGPFLHALKKAKARALGSDPAYEGEASSAYRDVIESSGSEEDVRAFEAFIESRPSAEERLRERRWLYERRVTHGARPEEVLLEWAKAEEELGEVDAAIALYVRLSEVAPGKREGLEALCRLQLHSGDFEGGLLALQRLRQEGTEMEQRAVMLSMARLLLEDLGRPAEAALALAPLLDVVPPIAVVHQMMARTLAEPSTRTQIVERLEQLASQQDDAVARRVFQFLVQARDETAGMPARPGWFQRIVELSRGDREGALRSALSGVAEFPDAAELWQSAERIALELQQPATVSKAYYDVLVGSVIDSDSAETLARRMVAFEGEYGSSSSRLIEALQRVLDLAPGARWALDRVKLVLGSEARWDELFRLYDRSIAAASSERERSDLLDEAASAAKDLAGQPDRAIPYLQVIHSERPDDAAVDAALERLYERQGLTPALIDLLGERLDKSAGWKRRELLYKLAALWVDLGGAEQALEIVERSLEEGASVGDLIEPLERLAGGLGVEAARDAATGRALAVQERAIQWLRGHYETSGRAEDVVRMAGKQLALAQGAASRARRIRDLVALRLAGARGASNAFEQAFPLVQSDVAGDLELGGIAHEAMLKSALRAWHAAPADMDAQDGAWRAIQVLKALLVEAGRARRAASLLYRSSRLGFAIRRKRELLRDAALVRAEGLADPERAIRIFGELFDEDAGDEVASQSVEPYTALLDAAAQHATLAVFWEEQGRIHAEAGDTPSQRVSWERAAALWQRQGDRAKAIRAYRQAAALASELAFEALARIYEEHDEWAPAAEALEWLYAHAPAEVRGVRALQLSRAYVALGDRGRARSRLEHALETGVEASSADLVPQALIALYRRDKAWRPLAERLASEALRAQDLEKKLALLREASELLREKLGAPAEAAALLEQAVQFFPRDGALRPLLADVLEELGRWDRVVEVLRDQIAWHGEQRTKERALSHHRLARALVHAGLQKDALAELRLAAEMLPAHPGILHGLARAALYSGKLELAESTYRALLLALHHPAESVGGTAAPHRAEVFLDLSEIALRNGDAVRAADLVDSAVDVALEGGGSPERFEPVLAQRGRYDLLARAMERRVDRGATLTARAVALGDLVGVWIGHLDRAPDLEARIFRHAERIGREIEHDGTTDADAWTALVAVHTLLGDAGAKIGTNPRLMTLLEAAVSKSVPGNERSRLRVILAKALLHDPATIVAAIAALSEALDEDPAQTEAADLLSDALERQGRFDERLAVLARRVRGLSPHTPSFVDAAWALGNALDRAERTKDALAVYESIVEDVPLDGPVIHELADRLEALGSERAATCLERLIAGGQGASELARRLLERCDREGNPARVQRALELVFSADPQDVVVARRLIDAYRASGDDPAVLRVLDAALAALPHDPALLRLRASIHEARGETDSALVDLESASAVDASSLDALLELRGRLDESWFGPVADAHTARGIDLLLRADRVDDARRELDRLLARSPDHPGGLEKLGALSVASGDWDSAIDAYRKAMRAAHGDPRETLPRVAALMAEACERAGRVEDAREAVEGALDLVPDSPELMKWLERICEKTGDWARVVDLLATQSDKKENAADRAELLLRAGTLALEKVHAPETALRLADQARAANGESLEGTLLGAQVQQATGHPREALVALEEAAQKSRGKRSPLIARVYLEMGKAHLAVDELIEALEALKVAFSMDARSGEIAMLLGLVAFDLDDERTAERVFLGVAGKTPQTDAEKQAQAKAYTCLASMAYAKGELAKARRLVGKAIGVEPSHPEALALLEKLGDPGAATAASAPPGPARA